MRIKWLLILTLLAGSAIAGLSYAEDHEEMGHGMMGEKGMMMKGHGYGHGMGGKMMPKKEMQKQHKRMMGK